MGPRRRAISILALVGLAFAAMAPGLARAETDYFAPQEIVFRVERDRTTTERLILGSLAGGAVVAGGLGVLFTLDSKDKSDQVSAIGRHTGRIYTQEVDDIRVGALRSRTRAIVSYSAGGALLIGAVAYYIATDPGTEVVSVREHEERERRRREEGRSFHLGPVPGGVMAGTSWSF